jgi:DNA-binding NarL/FixJ family response regulator
MAIRIAICDERPLVGNGLRTLLGDREGIEVTAVIDTMATALSVVRLRRPDVLVVAPRLRDAPGLDLVRRLPRQGGRPLPPVLAWGFGSEQDVAALIRAGVNGILAEDAGRAELVAAVRTVAYGGAALGPGQARLLLDWLRAGDVPSGPGSDALTLTDREREVMVLTAQGMSVTDIAGRLFIGTATVRTHLYRLRSKLGARDKAQLVSYAYQAGLVPTPGAAAV